MKILLVSATPFEIAPTTQFLQSNFQQTAENHFSKEGLDMSLLVTGVGMVATAWRLGQYLAREKPDLALNVGVAGAFDAGLTLGEVVHVTSERFGDVGVEEADGRFTDLFTLGLTERYEPPFINGVLHNPAAADTSFLPSVKGLTVNRVHGHAPSIAAVRERYPEVQVESMEGAAFFYACLLSGIPFLEIRSLSNYVEPRNRAAWQLPLALDNLNEVLGQLLQSLVEGVDWLRS